MLLNVAQADIFHLMSKIYHGEDKTYLAGKWQLRQRWPNCMKTISMIRNSHLETMIGG